MKLLNLKYLILIAAVALPLQSCDDYLDINSDPNKSTISRVDLQLSSALLYFGNSMGTQSYDDLCVLAQYWTGGPGVALIDADRHAISPNTSNFLFNNFYRGMSNLYYITKNSKDPAYLAIANILYAYGFQVNADLFGDIPYSEALKGDITDGSILHPKYESAKDVVYPGIIKSLNSAIAALDAHPTTHPGSDDLVYGGDLEKWSKFAKSLLLKIQLRSGATSLDASITADAVITSNDDNAMIKYPGGTLASNPWWQDANSTSLGNFYVGTTTTITHLISTADPRINAFYNYATGTTHTGLKPGDISNQPASALFSRPNGAKITGGGVMFSPTNPVIFMSAWEVNFLLAEAASKGLISGDAKTFYDKGVKASMNYLGITDDAAINAYLAGSGGYDASNSIKSIAIQKWASFNALQPIEGWIETRRFDNTANPIFQSPGGLFTPPTFNTLGGSTYPSILPYPETEQSLNKSFPGQHPITDKVFWDK